PATLCAAPDPSGALEAGDGLARVRLTRRPIQSLTLRGARCFMSPRRMLICAGAAVLLAASPPAAPDYAIAPVPYSRVDITDDFWAPKIEVNRKVSIRQLIRMYEQHGRFDSPRVIEAAAYMLAVRRDPDLEHYIDELIDSTISA